MKNNNSSNPQPFPQEGNQSVFSNSGLPIYQPQQNKLLGGIGSFFGKVKSILKKNFLLYILFFGLVGGGVGIYQWYSNQIKPEPSYVLRWWGLWENDEAVKEIISDYQSTHPRVTIKYERQSKLDYRERLVNALIRGNGPDIFRFHNTWVPMLKNELAPISSLVIDPQFYQSTFYPVVSQDLQIDRMYYGVPLMIDGLGLYFNEELFEKANLSPPTLWSEFEKTALALTMRDEKGRIIQSGAAIGEVQNVDHWQDIFAIMMIQNGVDLFNPTGPLAEDALKKYTDFVMTHKVWDETLPPSTVAFASGKTAMYFGPSWRAPEIIKMNPNLRFRVVPIPQLPKISENDAGRAWASYWVEGVSKRSKAQQQALEFLKYVSGPSQLEKLYTRLQAVGGGGEPYPRIDMANILQDDPEVGAYIRQAPIAQSWYLASFTYDGGTGINSRLSTVFEKVISSVLAGENYNDALALSLAGINEIRADYNLR